MRKVDSASDEADVILEEKMRAFEAHLRRSEGEFDSIAESSGLSAAAQSLAAQAVAQYGEALRVLSVVRDDSGGDKWVRHMTAVANEAVDRLRDADAPRWKHLASATVLEVLAECLGVS